VKGRKKGVQHHLSGVAGKGGGGKNTFTPKGDAPKKFFGAVILPWGKRSLLPLSFTFPFKVLY